MTYTTTPRPHFALTLLLSLLCGAASLPDSVFAAPPQADASGKSAADDSQASWQAGLARVVITPEELMWMSGYGGRSKPAEGKLHDLHARVAVLRAGEHTAVMVSLDLITVPTGMSARIAAAVEKKYQVPRKALMLTCSHTHCGPALDGKLSHMLAMEESDWEQVRAYQKTLDANVLAAIDTAFEDLQPARVEMGQGTTGFAVNRRRPIGEGPTDHDVPVLRIASADGKKLRGVIFGYACHNTTLSFYQWCGDYAGFAALDLEDRHPDAVALFFSGCGADQNPLPRRTVELARKYGRLLSTAVSEVLKSPMTPLSTDLETRYREIDLAYASLPTREEIEKQLESGNRYQKARARLLLDEFDTNGKLAGSHPYPIQVWRLGNRLTWIALGGEVVVDYAVRLKRELGRETTWVTGYANHVMAYIPSERILKEGGYEGGSSMVYYQLPSAWKPGLEDQIVRTVHELAKP